MTDFKQLADDAKPPCEQCGKTGDSVRYIVDPFASDIYGDDTLHWLCEDCEYQNAMDI